MFLIFRTARNGTAHALKRRRMEFEEVPLLVIWETTQACDLPRPLQRLCGPARHPRELNTEKGYRLLDGVRGFSAPILSVLTGGDRLKRADLGPRMRYSVASGLRTNVHSSVTPVLTPAAGMEFQHRGVNRMAIRWDGADAETHDSFREVPGTFDRATADLQQARSIGLETQVQTTAIRRGMQQFPLIAARFGRGHWQDVEPLPSCRHGACPRRWRLDRAGVRKGFETMGRLSAAMLSEVMVAEALRYRRSMAQAMRTAHGAEAGTARRVIHRTAGVSDGRGPFLISHTGDFLPGGLLPLNSGNVRTDSLAGVSRNVC